MTKLSSPGATKPTEAFTCAINHPFERLGQRFAEDQPTGFADGRQAHVRPVLRTVVSHLPHEGGIRQDDQMHVPGLAQAVSELTLTHAEMLLSVPMEGLCPCPAFPIRLEHAMDFPIGAIGD